MLACDWKTSKQELESYSFGGDKDGRDRSKIGQVRSGAGGPVSGHQSYSNGSECHLALALLSTDGPYTVTSQRTCVSHMHDTGDSGDSMQCVPGQAGSSPVPHTNQLTIMWH